MERDLDLLAVKRIIELLNAGDYEDSDTGVNYDESMTFIHVDEEDDGVTAYFGCREESPTHGLSEPYTEHTVKVDGFVFSRTEEGESCVDDWYINGTGETVSEVSEELEEALDEIVGSVCPAWPGAYEQFEAEWTHEQIVEEIISQLSCDTYIGIDGSFYPVRDSVEEFLRVFYSDDADGIRNCAYEEYDTRSLAEKLADGIDFEC